MPITIYEVGDGLGGYIVYEGKLRTLDELAIHAALLSWEPKLRIWMFILLDYSAAEDIDFTSAELVTIAESAKRIATVTRDGFVLALVTPLSHVFGLARMWQVFSEPLPWETVVFRSLDEAERWVRKKVSATFGTELDRPIKEFPLTKVEVVSVEARRAQLDG